MKRISTVLLTLCCAAPALFFGCSFDVAGGGGTETGNPEAVACAKTAFDALDVVGQWCPIGYVPGGQSRLDPLSVQQGEPTYGMAKAGALPDTIVATDTLYVLDTVPVRDTAFRPETTFVRDTAFRVVTVHDTLDTTGPGDTSAIIYTKRVTDSVVVVDTIVGIDTIIYQDTVYVRDTLYPGDTLVVGPTGTRTWYYGALPGGVDNSSPAANVKIQTAPAFNDVAYTDSGPSYEFVNYSAPVGQRTSYMLVPAANFSTGSLSALTSVEKRYATTSGALVVERYTDLDGDELLLCAAGASTPRALFAVTMSEPSRVQTVFSDFDAGADLTLTSAADNRLLRLQRRTVSPDSTQTVAYNWNPALPGVNDSSLSVTTFLNRGEAESLTVAYGMALGPNRASWDDDVLKVLRVSKVLRSGVVGRVDMVITPVAALRRTEAASSATVDATVTMFDGTVYTIVGATVDLSRDLFEANYDKGGAPARVWVERRALQ